MNSATSSSPSTGDAVDPRWTGISRLYGVAGVQRLQASHAMVIGLGGVGSWTVEALARSGVGRLTLVDLDDICVSNTNRQLHTLTGTIGRTKAEVLAERVAAIAPNCRVEALVDFFTASSEVEILGRAPDVVVDAIDSQKSKAVLIAACLRRSIPVLVCGGAGGRIDPLALRRGDLSASGHDGLLRNLRKALRESGVLQGAGPWGIPAIWSMEPQRWPTAYGCVAEARPADSKATRLDCADGFGAATMVTGTFGFALASMAVEVLLNDRRPSEMTAPRETDAVREAC